MNRRLLLGATAGLLFAPRIVRSPGILMPIRPAPLEPVVIDFGPLIEAIENFRRAHEDIYEAWMANLRGHAA